MSVAAPMIAWRCWTAQAQASELLTCWSVKPAPWAAEAKPIARPARVWNLLKVSPVSGERSIEGIAGLVGPVLPVMVRITVAIQVLRSASALISPEDGSVMASLSASIAVFMVAIGPEPSGSDSSPNLSISP